jgi:xylan 1,4-beta-xylosidase
MGDHRLKVDIESGPASEPHSASEAHSASEDHSTVEALAVAGDGNLIILVYNHDIPSTPLQSEEVWVRLKGIRSRKPAKLIRIDPQHTNPKKKWIELGSPEYPTQNQLAQIAHASHPRARSLRPEAGEPGCAFRFTIPAHSVAAIVVEG